MPARSAEEDLRRQADRRCIPQKIGNAHLTWAFSEAVTGLLRDSEEVKRLKACLAKKNGEGRALSILAARLGRSLYHMLRKREAVDMKRYSGQTELVAAH